MIPIQNDVILRVAGAEGVTARGLPDGLLYHVGWKVNSVFIQTQAHIPGLVLSGPAQGHYQAGTCHYSQAGFVNGANVVRRE